MSENQVRVQTNDGNIIAVDLDIAKQWTPIKDMYEVFGTVDTTEKPIELENVNAETLNKIIEWAIHHREDTVNTDENDTRPKRVDLSSWDQTFLKVGDNMKQEMLFDIIMASNYLGMTVLLDMACKTVAEMIKGKTPEEVRQTFNIPNDLPPLEQPE